MTVKEVAVACGGRIEDADPDATVTSVTTDSRVVEPGALFVALPGERADGHAFAPDAAARGAVAVLASDAVAAPAVRCEDPLAALSALAAEVRSRLGARVIAITGSSGKTGTKDLIAAATATVFETVASRASFNNEIGVPLTVCEASASTEVLVLEVGARGPGHIAALAPVVRPDVSVVTNVGLAHVGMFGSIDATARAKGELVEMLGAGGVAVLNADDPRVAAMASRAPGRVVTFGDEGDVRASGVRLDELARPSFRIEAFGSSAEVSMRMSGQHAVANALAAAAAAVVAGVPLSDAARGIAAADGSAMRMQIVEAADGTVVINDAYNANPSSMAAALRSLQVIAGGRPAWAVLGHMAELGDAADAEHDRIGRLVAQLGIYHLVTVGEEAKVLHAAARSEGLRPEEAVFAHDVDDAISTLRATMEPGAVVLVKASRAAGLERVADAIATGGRA